MHSQLKPVFVKRASHPVERVGLHVQFAIGFFHIPRFRIWIGNDCLASERLAQITEFESVRDGFVGRRFFMQSATHVQTRHTQMLRPNEGQRLLAGA